MSDPAKKRASYADVLAAPEHKVAEVIAGVLYTQPRPRVRHALAESRLLGELSGFDRSDADSKGGWVMLVEPELHLGPDIDILVPDLAGWRRARMPALPIEAAYITLAPDWVCEVLSPSTEAIDRAEKMPVYAREGVACVWLLDPDAQLLEVYELEGGRWMVAQVFRGGAVVRARPFEAKELRLSALWAV